ncbi:uncharacterized protein LOC116922534 [Daphnia magna]|uniref:uncharacterized protein LOC116922534 n=1 Tax=Daphnia magna TaxID=35525 RepID=UPI001E1BA090|nr:uncharacterized protein LOC116922534 [Daphnia magna]
MSFIQTTCFTALAVFVLVSCLARLIEAESDGDEVLLHYNRSALALKSRDKRWILEEIFHSTVNYFKWNFVGRISVSLIDELMKFIDPVVNLLLPRGASTFASFVLSAIYRKLQFAIMYWFNSLFFSL